MAQVRVRNGVQAPGAIQVGDPRAFPFLEMTLTMLLLDR